MGVSGVVGMGLDCCFLGGEPEGLRRGVGGRVAVRSVKWGRSGTG